MAEISVPMLLPVLPAARSGVAAVPGIDTQGGGDLFALWMQGDAPGADATPAVDAVGMQTLPVFGWMQGVSVGGDGATVPATASNDRLEGDEAPAPPAAPDGAGRPVAVLLPPAMPHPPLLDADGGVAEAVPPCGDAVADQGGQDGASRDRGGADAPLPDRAEAEGTVGRAPLPAATPPADPVQVEMPPQADATPPPDNPPPAVPPVATPATTPANPPPPRLAAPVPPADLPQVVAQAVAAAPDGVLELTLSPKELGPLRIEVQPMADGLRVTLYAERAEAMDLIRRHAGELLDELRQAGLGQASLGFGPWAEGRRDDGQGGKATPPPAPPDGLRQGADAGTSALRQDEGHRSPPSGGLNLRL